MATRGCAGRNRGDGRGRAGRQRGRGCGLAGLWPRGRRGISSLTNSYGGSGPRWRSARVWQADALGEAFGAGPRGSGRAAGMAGGSGGPGRGRFGRAGLDGVGGNRWLASPRGLALARATARFPAQRGPLGGPRPSGSAVGEEIGGRRPRRGRRGGLGDLVPRFGVPAPDRRPAHRGPRGRVAGGWVGAGVLLPGAEDADEGGVRDADVVTRKGPAVGVAAGPWW